MLARRALIAGCLALPLAGCGAEALRAHEARALQAWDEARAQVRRMVGVLPPMLTIVRAQAPQEREVLAEVTAALAAAGAAPGDAETPRNPDLWRAHLDAVVRLSNAVQTLLATVERYLDLKRNAGYLALRTELTLAQDRAAVARDDYNDAARAYNAGLEGISGRLARLRDPEARPLPLFTGLPASR